MMNEIRLPLFPLHMVLFPGHPLHLQIFEQRYKKMIEACLQDDESFGVLLIKKGQEALGPLAETFSVGCRVKIDEIQRLEGGRMRLTAFGIDRFKVRSFDYETSPFLTGMVEPFPFAPYDAGELQEGVERLRGWVVRYLQALIDSGRVKITSTATPDEAEALAFMAIAILPLDLRRKQELFSYEDLPELVRDLISLFRLELALINKVLGKPTRSTGISAN